MTNYIVDETNELKINTMKIELKWKQNENYILKIQWKVILKIKFVMKLIMQLEVK